MRFLFSALSSYGFLFPAIGIAEELRKRGHSVAFATDPSMREVLAAVGMQRIARGSLDGPSFQIQYAGHPVESIRQAKHLTRAIRLYSPDVLVGTELAHGTVVAGEHNRVPTAMIGLGTYLWKSRATERIENPERREWIKKRHNGWIRSLQLTRAAFGLPIREVVSVDDNPLLGDLYFLRTVAELEGCEEVEALPQQVHLVGGCLWSNVQDDDELNHWLADADATGQPIVYAQLGRFFEKPGFWSELVEAFAHREIHVAVSVGRMDRPIGQIPRNFFVRGHVPQELVLPHARAVICTSTTTPVIGALTQGVPLLLIPGGGGGEQGDLINRCLRAGVARYLGSTHATARNILSELQVLLEDANPLLQSARELRPPFERAGGTRNVADHLERLSSERVPFRGDS